MTLTVNPDFLSFLGIFDRKICVGTYEDVQMAFKTGIHGCLIDDKLVSFLQILGTKRKDWERARNLQRSGMDD